MDNINYLDQEYMEKLLTNFSKATGLFIEAVDVYGKTFFTPKDIEMCEFCSYIRSNEEAIKKCEQSYRKACQEAFILPGSAPYHTLHQGTLTALPA